MMLATTKIEDFDRFLKIFSTKGAEKQCRSVKLSGRMAWALPRKVAHLDFHGTRVAT